MPFTARLRSFANAFAGLFTMLRTQPNAWIHAIATAAVCGTGLYIGLSVSEWCFIVVAIAIVWTAEALNTAIEELSDVASPDPHPGIRKAKDIAAGGVLVAAIGAAVIGVLILGPHLMALFR